MPDRSVELHPEALLEARAAFEWYRERNPAAAAAFLTEIDTAINEIATTPERWPGFLHGTRRFLLHRFPFSVVYRVADAVIHGCRFRACAAQAGIPARARERGEVMQLEFLGKLQRILIFVASYKYALILAIANSVSRRLAAKTAVCTSARGDFRPFHRSLLAPGGANWRRDLPSSQHRSRGERCYENQGVSATRPDTRRGSRSSSAFNGEATRFAAENQIHLLDGPRFLNKILERPPVDQARLLPEPEGGQ